MSNNNSIHLAKQVDTASVTYDGPQANNYGGKFAKVLHKNSWLFIQTPKILSPFGVNVYEDIDKKTGEVLKKTYSIDISFDGYMAPEGSNEIPKPKVKDTYDLIVNMESHLVKHASENSFTWVDDEDASEVVCKALLRSGIKWSKDKETGRINKKYAPRLKLNLPVWEDGMGFKAFLDSPDNPITTIEELLKIGSGRCDIVAIVKCDKVTFNGGKYGYKWNVQQLKIYTSKTGMSGYSFIEDSGDEGEEGGEGEGEEEEESSNMVQDTESEDGGDGGEGEDGEGGGEDGEGDELDNHVSDEEEETVAPPAVKPKRTVVKRKGAKAN